MSRMTGLEPKAYPRAGGGWLVTCTTPGGDIHIEYDAEGDVTVSWKPADGAEPVAGTVHTGPAAPSPLATWADSLADRDAAPVKVIVTGDSIGPVT